MNTDQHITATISLAGAQHPVLSSHGDGGPGSTVQIADLGVLITLYDRLAVKRYATLWNEAAGRVYANALPLQRDLTLPKGASTITLAIRARSAHTATITPGPDCVVVTIGSVHWAVYDQLAFRGQVDLWTKVTQLADLVLPHAFVSTAS